MVALQNRATIDLGLVSLDDAAPLGYGQLVERLGYATPKAAANALVTAKRRFEQALRSVIAEYVADAVRVVRDSGLPNRTDAMFTTVEGDWDEVMDVVKRAVEAVAAKAPRLSLTLKADVRPGVTGALESKVEALERYLGT